MSTRRHDRRRLAAARGAAGGRGRAGVVPLAVRAAAGARLPGVHHRALRPPRSSTRHRRGAAGCVAGRAAVRARLHRRVRQRRRAARRARRRSCWSTRTCSQRVLGGVTIVLGLAFMGFVPWLQRDVRLHRSPAVGLAGAPVLGVLFGLGWTPCIGPTLGAVWRSASTRAPPPAAACSRSPTASVSACRSCSTALAFRRALGAFGWVKRHYAGVMRTGGAMLVAIGVLLVTGALERHHGRSCRSGSTASTPAV